MKKLWKAIRDFFVLPEPNEEPQENDNTRALRDRVAKNVEALRQQRLRHEINRTEASRGRRSNGAR